jgi:NAD-dependent SIR2 family protein deacetylase
MEIVSIILGIITGAGVLALLFIPFFGDRDGFIECVKFWIRPDIFSLFSGEYFKDRWSEWKLGMWILLGTMAGFGVYAGLMKLFG